MLIRNSSANEILFYYSDQGGILGVGEKKVKTMEEDTTIRHGVQ